MSFNRVLFRIGKVTDMKVADNTSVDVHPKGGDMLPPSTGLTPDALPEVQQSIEAENSQTGVSTRNVPLPKEIQEARRALRTQYWYAVRCTYGKEIKAYEFLKDKVKAYCPTIEVTKLVNNRRKTEKASYNPNVLFLHGTFDEVKAFVYDNQTKETKPLRFFYRYTYNEDYKVKRELLTVPDQQMESLRIICASQADDILLIPQEIEKFKKGQTVRVIGGEFKGVVGKVTRYQGQQRVVVIIEGVMNAATAYVPSAFLKKVEEAK